MTDPADRLQALAERCVRCALCLPHCPTYRLDQVEGESPRGRIQLADALAGGRLDAAESAHWQRLDHCLGCRRCEAVCPAGVEYGALLVAARTLQRRHTGAPWRRRILEWSAERPRLLARLLRLAGRLRVWLPRSLGARLPPVPHAPVASGRHPAPSPARGTVALFLGCVARGYETSLQQAAIAVLNRLGWNVVVPPAQTCCGALHAHGGDAAAAARLAERNRAAFAGVTHVLVPASGCLDALRQALAARDTAVADLCAFVAADPALPELSLRRIERTVAVHVPCTQATVAGAGPAAATLLARIDGLRLAPVAGLGCCGAAGDHMLLQPTRAAALRAPLLAEIADSGAGQVLSGNIGCRLHLQQGLTGDDAPPVRHPIELLAEALT